MSKRALLTAAIVAALGTWVHIGNTAADCIVPLSGSFGFTTAAGSLPANPFVLATDTTVPANGFADTLGTVAGFTNGVPYTTFPQGPAAATEPVCHQFCPGGVNPSPATGPCVTEILVRGNDGNIYRCAFKETNAGGVFAGADASLGVFASGDTGGSAGDAAGNEDGFLANQPLSRVSLRIAGGYNTITSAGSCLSLNLRRTCPRQVVDGNSNNPDTGREHVALGDGFSFSASCIGRPLFVASLGNGTPLGGTNTLEG